MVTAPAPAATVLHLRLRRVRRGRRVRRLPFGAAVSPSHRLRVELRPAHRCVTGCVDNHADSPARRAGHRGRFAKAIDLVWFAPGGRRVRRHKRGGRVATLPDGYAEGCSGATDVVGPEGFVQQEGVPGAFSAKRIDARRGTRAPIRRRCAERDGWAVEPGDARAGAIVEVFRVTAGEGPRPRGRRSSRVRGRHNRADVGARYTERRAGAGDLVEDRGSEPPVGEFEIGGLPCRCPARGIGRGEHFSRLVSAGAERRARAGDVVQGLWERRSRPGRDAAGRFARAEQLALRHHRAIRRAWTRDRAQAARAAGQVLGDPARRIGRCGR